MNVWRRMGTAWQRIFKDEVRIHIEGESGYALEITEIKSKGSQDYFKIRISDGHPGMMLINPTKHNEIQIKLQRTF